MPPNSFGRRTRDRRSLRFIRHSCCSVRCPQRTFAGRPKIKCAEDSARYSIQRECSGRLRSIAPTKSPPENIDYVLHLAYPQPKGDCEKRDCR